MRHQNENSEYIRRVLTDIRQLSADEIKSLHGITIEENGELYDEAFDQRFKDVADWVSFSEKEEDNEFEKFGHFGHGEDDY